MKTKKKKKKLMGVNKGKIHKRENQSEGFSENTACRAKGMENV